MQSSLKIFFQSALPRFGSTLFQNLIAQNSDFYVIGATRSGQPLNWPLLHSFKSQNNKPFLIIFGPIKGSLKKYIKNHKEVDIWINFIPLQATKTVKIEEALHSSLSILNINSLNFE